MKTGKQVGIVFTLATLATTALHATVWPGGGNTMNGYHDGSVVTISWKMDNATGNVDVGLWDGDRSEYRLIARNIAQDQHEMKWTIPSDVQPGQHYRFFVQIANNTERREFSDGFITIERTEKSVAEMNNVDNKLSCAPVPASDLLSVVWSYDNAYRIELRDRVDKLIEDLETAPENTSQQFSVSDLASGVYFVRLYLSSGEVITKSVVVQR